MNKKQLIAAFWSCILLFSMFICGCDFLRDRFIVKNVKLEFCLATHSEKTQIKDLDTLVDNTAEIILTRLRKAGVRNPEVIRQNQDIIVKAEVDSKKKYLVKYIISTKGKIELKLVNRGTAKLSSALSGQTPEGFELKYLDGEPLLIEKQALLIGDYLIATKVKFGLSNRNPLVFIKLNREGSKIFSKLTAENIGTRLTIILDGKVLSAPQIKEKIPLGELVITGMDLQEANALVIVLKTEELPLEVSIIDEKSILKYRYSLIHALRYKNK